MTRAEQIIDLLDAHHGKKKRKKKYMAEGGDKSSTDGDPSHYHELTRNDDGEVTGHGPANEGEKHKHPIKEDGLGPADNDGHTHSF